MSKFDVRVAGDGWAVEKLQVRLEREEDGVAVFLKNESGLQRCIMRIRDNGTCRYSEAWAREFGLVSEVLRG